VDILPLLPRPRTQLCSNLSHGKGISYAYHRILVLHRRVPALRGVCVGTCYRPPPSAHHDPGGISVGQAATLGGWAVVLWAGERVHRRRPTPARQERELRGAPARKVGRRTPQLHAPVQSGRPFSISRGDSAVLFNQWGHRDDMVPHQPDRRMT